MPNHLHKTGKDPFKKKNSFNTYGRNIPVSFSHRSEKNLKKIRTTKGHPTLLYVTNANRANFYIITYDTFLHIPTKTIHLPFKRIFKSLNNTLKT